MSRCRDNGAGGVAEALTARERREHSFAAGASIAGKRRMPTETFWFAPRDFPYTIALRPYAVGQGEGEACVQMLRLTWSSVCVPGYSG